MDSASDPERSNERNSVAIQVYLRLVDAETAEVVAVLAKDDDAVAAVPRIGEEYVTAASYGVPVTAVEHDTTTGEHQVAVFLDEEAIDPDPLIELHVDSGWVLVHDERESSDAASG